MTNSEIFNFARSTLHELDVTAMNAADYQCILALTPPRVAALQRVLTFYILNHSLNLPDQEPS